MLGTTIPTERRENEFSHPNSQNYFISASGFKFMVKHLQLHCVTEKVGKPNMWSRTHARERKEARSHRCLLPNPASCDVWYVKVKWPPLLNNSDEYRKIGFQMNKILAWNSVQEVLLPSSLCVHPMLQYSTLLYVFVHAILSTRRVLCFIYVFQTPIKWSNFYYFC